MDSTFSQALDPDDMIHVFSPYLKYSINQASCGVMVCSCIYRYLPQCVDIGDNDPVRRVRDVAAPILQAKRDLLLVKGKYSSKHLTV